jgi:hypothetical protein
LPVRKTATLLLLVVSSIGSLLVGEGAVRLSARLTHRVPLVVSDADAGWALQPGLHNELRVGDGGRYAMSTDDEGHRLTRAAAEPADGSRPALILVGDSFVQGQSVNDPETFGWLLAQEMPLRVVNLGVLGYGTDQELLGLAAYLKSHPSLDVRDIVLVVFENDFIDVQTSAHPALGRSKPLLRVTDGRLQPVDYHRTFSDRLMDVSYLYWLLNSKRTMLFKTPEPDVGCGTEVILACVAEMRGLAARRGARFHVVAHRHLRVGKPFPDSLWSDFVQRAGATDITPRLRAMQGADPVGYDGGHWSAAGHRLVAEIVREMVDKDTSAVGHRHE